MTFHAYLQYVSLLVVCLYTVSSPMEARVQADRQSTGTRDTLLVIDQESGLPIEGAYILTGERLLVSSPPWNDCFQPWNMFYGYSPRAVPGVQFPACAFERGIQRKQHTYRMSLPGHTKTRGSGRDR